MPDNPISVHPRTENVPVRRPRVALMGIYHESNTFISRPTVYKDFQLGHLLRGETIIEEYRDAYHEIGGMLEVAATTGMEIVPIVFAEATPGGTVSSETYRLLLQELLEGLSRALPVDACLVVPHGAGVAEGYPDMDGHWLSAIRDIVGEGIPIAGTLDPHANLSEAMVNATDVLVAYSTNPHIDQRETGRKAALLLARTLAGDISPSQNLFASSVAISIEQQFTSAEPCKSLYAEAAEWATQPGILSISILLGFPYADVWEMGSSFLVITDRLAERAGSAEQAGSGEQTAPQRPEGSAEQTVFTKQPGLTGQTGPQRPVGLAEQAGNALVNTLEQQKEKFSGDKKGIRSVLPLLSSQPRPVLLLDMGDNVGGGAPGNSAYLLNALEASGQYRFFICLYDPDAVAVASGHALSDRFMISVGNHERGMDKFCYTGEVVLEKMADGRFTEKTPRHGGQMNYNMGPTVLVRTQKQNLIMIHSLRVPPFSLSQITSFGVLPHEFDVIVAKGVNAPIAAYGPVCPTIIQVDTPGVTQADMTRFVYHRRRKPLFPFE